MTELWCYIEGECEIFSVPFSPHLSIHGLKRQIKKERGNLLLRVDAASLTLIKVDVNYNEDSETRKKIKAGEYRPTTNDQVLDSTNIISDIWERPPDRHLHVFVSLPSVPDVVVQPPLKRLRMSDSEDPGLPWLKEIHSKIWNCRDRGDLELKLFRKVEVTRAHYDELQVSLDQKYPDRNSPQYNGGRHKVLSDKLEHLNLIAAGHVFPPRDPDNNKDRVDDSDDLEASNKGGFDIDSFFPFTLTYLDLSILELENELKSCSFPLFIRQEYNHLSELINERPQSGAGSVIVSGQPGTGKTTYLYLRIVEFLIAGRPFLYQSTRGSVYHVTQNGVVAIRSWSSKTYIVAFVDGDEEDYRPQRFLFDYFVQIIVASSPQTANRSWVKKAIPSTTIITKFATCLWSPCEVFLTGMFLHPRDITCKLLRKSVSYVGYNPRECFNASYSVTRLNAKKAAIKKQISGITGKTSDTLRALYSYRMGASAFDLIFQLYPADESRLLELCHCETVSRWVFDSLLKACEDLQPDAAAIFYRDFSGRRWAASLRGCLFERQVLKYLDRIDTDSDLLICPSTDRGLSIRPLTDSAQVTWTYHGPIRRFTFEEPTVIDKIKKAVEANEPLHLVPSALNFPAVDSIVYYPNEVLTCIQNMIRKEHPIAVPGLQHIQGRFKPHAPSADLRPKVTGPRRFVFIVPPDMVLQKLKGDIVMGERAGTVGQYVLGLEVEVK